MSPAAGDDSAAARALLAQLPGQVAVVGAAGEVLAANIGWRHFVQAHGIDGSTHFGYLAACAAASGEDDGQARAAAAGIGEVLRGGRPEFTLDYPFHSATQRRWFRLQVVPVVWEGRAAALALHTDVTPLQEAREQVMRLNAHLERRVLRRTRQLEAANRELEAFSYSVSHDLKSPLAAIDGFTQVLGERLQGRLDERESGYMQRVRAGVASMFSLIDAMLGLHRLSRDTRLHRVVVDVSAQAAAIVAELREQEPGRACRIGIEPGIAMYCDAELMALALRNLIGNAWKFSARKALTVVEIALEADGPSELTTLRIADQGAGFDPEEAHRLFAPFQRLHHVSEFPGTGVGLASVQRIAQRHGGTVRADGRRDLGATFWLSLPRERSESAESTRDD